jgi:hypothetical protein
VAVIQGEAPGDGIAVVGSNTLSKRAAELRDEIADLRRFMPSNAMGGADKTRRARQDASGAVAGGRGDDAATGCLGSLQIAPTLGRSAVRPRFAREKSRHAP